MPASLKVSQQEIIEAAFNVVRRHGWTKLSARSIAKELNLSTMPIYHQFKSMVDLEEEIVKKAMALLKEYQSKPYTGDSTQDRGIGYVMFAREESHLFQAINDERHSAWQAKYGDATFDQHIEELASDPRVKGLTTRQLRHLNFLLWIFVHGVASLKNWMQTQQFSDERIVELMRDGSNRIVQGFLLPERKKKPFRKPTRSAR